MRSLLWRWGAASACAAVVCGVLVSPASQAADDAFLGSGRFVSDSTSRPQPSRTAPGVHSSYVDEAFGTIVRQLTGATSAGRGFVPEYSKAAAFNADGTRFIIRGTDASTRLFDAATVEEIETLPLPEGDIEPRWSPTDPDALTYIDNTAPGQVRKYSISSRQSTVLATYSTFGDLSSGSEQDHSRSGRYFALHGTEIYSGSTWTSTRAFVADLQTGGRGPVTTLSPPVPGDSLDYVAITPDDNYVMVMWALSGARLYTRDWTFVRSLTDWDEHGDFCRAKSGEDVFVIAHYRPEPNDEVVEFIPLSGTGRRVLWQAPRYNLALHISCRNTDLPGWAFLSSYWDGIGQRPGLTPFENEVFALSLESTEAVPDVRRLAHTGMVERADYFDEPHATASRDGRLVLFGSNFGAFETDAEYANAFAIDMRDGAPATRPAQSIGRGLPRKLRRGRRDSLPARTDQGQPLTWASMTRKTCRVNGGFLIGRRVGTCRLAATAPATSAWRAFSASLRIRIVR